MGQLSGMVVAFLYFMAAATPGFLTANPAHALSWALYYEVGRTFSILNVYGQEQTVVWPWLAVFSLSIAICFLDIRRKRFFGSSLVLLLLLVLTLTVVYVDYIHEIKNSSRIGLLSPWVKIAFLLVCSYFMYVALRSRLLQYRRQRLARR